MTERTHLKGINLQVEHDDKYRYTKYYLLDENDIKYPLSIEVDNKNWPDKLNRWSKIYQMLKQLHEINGLKHNL